MKVFDGFVLTLWVVVDDVSVVVENLARRLPWHLPTRLMEGQAEDVRCRGTIQPGVQCKRRPVSGTTYCYFHRDHAKSAGRLLVVIEARDKAVRMTGDISRKTRAATVSATTRLSAWSPQRLTQDLSSEQTARVRGVARRMVNFLQAKRRWVAFAMVVFVAAVPIAFQAAADGDLDYLVGFARDIFPRNAAAGQGDPNTFGRQETPTDEPNAAERFTLEGTRTPGTDFAGAYVSSVEHLSANNSMLQILVPAGVEGNYQAIVTASEAMEYQCVILLQYSDRLFCIGPSLPEGSQFNFRIFRIDEINGSQYLVFETNYTTGEFAPLPTPSPVFPVYGGAFIWPDRFDQVEIRKEQQSSAMLSPLSVLLGVVLLLMYRTLWQREHRLNPRLVESHELEPVH